MLVRRAWIASLALVTSLAGCGHAPSPAATVSEGMTAQGLRTGSSNWRDDVIYFAMLDRFNDGDRSNDFNVDRSNPGGFHGGDIQGLIDKLDYLQALGVTTIWVSPLLQNDETPLGSTNLWGYHGYWTKDFTTIDKHLGTTAKAQELVTKAHAKGLKILLDVVCNQAGYTFPVNDPKYAGWFHHNGNIQDWNNQWWLENGSLFGLPDFAQENPAVASFLIDTYFGWAKTLGVDGFRLDAVKHVPKSFWVQFNQQAQARGGSSFLTLGEVLSGDAGYVADYQRNAGFQSLFDFPLYYTFDNVFAQGGSMRQLGDRFAQDGAYADATMLSPFLDNHDVPRFLTRAGGDLTKLKVALACLLTIRGIPMVYYGTEVGMAGGGDPDNRRDMAFGSNEPMRAYTQSLLAIRKRSTALQHGRQLEMWQDDQVYAYLRQSPDAEAIVALNNTAGSQTRTLPLRAECRMPDGTQLVDQLTNETVAVQNRQVTLTMGPRQARILLPLANPNAKPPVQRRKKK